MGRILAALLLSLAATEAPAQVTCRSNGLGGETCVGVPTPEIRFEPYRPVVRGLRGVQAPAGAEGGPELTPARRTDVLGNTFLSAGDLPPDRPPRGIASPRNCTRDALGNLICN